MRGDWHDEARAMHAAGLSQREIAKRFGVTQSAVWKALNPERAREAARRTDADGKGLERRRRSAERNRVACIDCGGPAGVGSKWRGTTRCGSCHRAATQASKWERRRAIQLAWEDGLSLREIAEVLGCERVGSVKVEMARMRRDGWDLPRRMNWTDEGLARAAWRAAA